MSESKSVDDDTTEADVENGGSLDPSSIAEYVNHDRCARFIKQDVAGEEEATARPWEEAFSVLNPALLGYGAEVEAGHVENLAQNAVKLIGPDIDSSAPVAPSVHFNETWHESTRGRQQQLKDAIRTAATLNDPDSYILLYQAPLSGRIGPHHLAGDADLIALSSGHKNTSTDEVGASPENDRNVISDENRVEARIIEVKSSNEERAAHRVQVAIYTELLEQILAEDLDGITVDITGTVFVDEKPTRPGQVSSPFATETFRTDEWQLKVERLLASDGPITNALIYELVDLEYSLDQTCTNCSYQEACMTRAAEDVSGSLSLANLGLDAAAQDRLASVGITTLKDISELGARPFNPSPRDSPMELDVTPEQRETLDEIVGGSKHALVQRAQAVRGSIDPNYQAYSQPPAIQSTDYVPLPGNSRQGWGGLDDSSPGDLIHITFIVRPDPTIDRIAGLGATIQADNADGPVTVSELIEAVPNDLSRASERERELLDRFLTQLFDALETVAADVGNHENAILHTYFYSQQAREALAEGLDRHDDHDLVRALRSVLSLRAAGHTATDQEMVSVVQPTLHEHFALLDPNQGLLPVVEQFTGHPPGLLMSSPPGRYESAGRLFGYKFFSYGVPYHETSDGIRIHSAWRSRNSSAKSDGRYPARKREGAMLPIEYFWVVTPETKGNPAPRLRMGQIEDGTRDKETRQQYAHEIDRFRDPGPDTADELRRSDVEWLLGQLSLELYNLVDAVPYKDQYMEKEPVDITTLDGLGILDMSAPEAARDYLRMEYDARTTELVSLYRQPLRERVQTGQSLAFRCTDIEQGDDGGIIAQGEFIFEELFATKQAQSMAQQIRLHAGDGTTGGSWRVLTRLTSPNDNSPSTSGAGDRQRASTRSYTEAGINSPEAIKHSPPAFIEHLDPNSGTVTIRTFPHQFTKQYDEFRHQHVGWKTPDSDNLAEDQPEDNYVSNRDPVWIEPGHRYVLDPIIDDLTATKADHALKPASITQNAVYDQLLMAATSGISGYADVGDPRTIQSFLDLLDTTNITDTLNSDQRAIVEDLSAPVISVQGPAGTGKTSGATAPALLGRAYTAAQEGRGFFAIGVAPSHKAVDALLNGVVERLDEYREAFGWLQNLSLVRVLPTGITDTYRLDTEVQNVDISYLNYRNEIDQQALVTLVNRIIGPQQRLEPSQPGVLLFTTPSTLYRVLGVLAEGLGEIDGNSAPAAMRHGDGLADVVALDEASMVTVPQLMLASSPLKSRGQLLLIGDPRQLSTITAHDWDQELRASIRDMKVYLSAIEFVDELIDNVPEPKSGAGHPRVQELILGSGVDD